MLGVGRTKVFELIEAKKLRSVKIGSRRLVSDEAIADLIADLEAAS